MFGRTDCFLAFDIQDTDPRTALLVLGGEEEEELEYMELSVAGGV